MTMIRLKRTVLIGILLLATMLLASGNASAAALSNTLLFGFQVGAGVLTGNPNSVETCTVFNQCKPGQKSTLPGAFFFPWSVATTSNGDIYVPDQADRVQELGPDGKFIRMFGWNVNKTRVKEGAPQTADNSCTVEEVSKGTECGAGEAGSGQAGQLNPHATSVAVDPITHDVFVYEDSGRFRVEEFSETGEFKLMIGREVNKNGSSEDERNLCTQTESANCQPGKESEQGSTEHGAFKPDEFNHDLLAVCENKLYVADEARVQEFNVSSGSFAGELQVGPSKGFPVHGEVTGITLDHACDIYLVESHQEARNGGAPGGVYEYSPSGKLLNSFDTASTEIEAIALDPLGNRMGLIEGPTLTPHGVLFDLTTDKQLSEFAPPEGMSFETSNLAFNAQGEVYVADIGHHDVELYHPVSVAEVLTEVKPPCASRPGARGTRELTFEGSINPEGIPDTEGWFAYGPTRALGSMTPKQPFSAVEGQLPLDATVPGLVPNTLYYYRGEAIDHNASSSGEILTCKTRAESPIVGCCPHAHISSSTFATVVLEEEIDPENASTEYWYEYAEAAPCAQKEEEFNTKYTVNECPGVRKSAEQSSAEYGFVLDQQTINELPPATTYRFRLTGDNEFKYENEREGGPVRYEQPSESEGTFTTGNAPVPVATTLPASNVGATAATLLGTVNPNGSSAAYKFELGLDRGTATEYGTVLSASVGAGHASQEEQYSATSLQPGTRYLYRITAHNGYGEPVHGESVAFITADISELKSPIVLPPVPIPPIPFPKSSAGGSKGKSNSGQLERALRACRHRPKRQQAMCKRRAHENMTRRVNRSKPKGKVTYRRST